MNLPNGHGLTDASKSVSQHDTTALQNLNLQAIRERVMELQVSTQKLFTTFERVISPVKWVKVFSSCHSILIDLRAFNRQDVMAQFAVVNMEFFKLMEDLKPILKLFLVYPWQATVEYSQSVLFWYNWKKDILLSANQGECSHLSASLFTQLLLLCYQRTAFQIWKKRRLLKKRTSWRVYHLNPKFKWNVSRFFFNFLVW